MFSCFAAARGRRLRTGKGYRLLKQLADQLTGKFVGADENLHDLGVAHRLLHAVLLGVTRIATSLAYTLAIVDHRMLAWPGCALNHAAR